MVPVLMVSILALLKFVICQFTNYVFLFTQQTIQDSISPVWEEPFRFLIHDPKYQELDIEVSWIFVSFCFDYC